MLTIAAFSYKSIGIDFTSRYNEVTAVVDGTDPFLIWNGTVDDHRFYPYNHPELKISDAQSHIHAYSPWSYTYLMPIVMSMPLKDAWVVQRGIMFISIAITVCLAYWKCFRIRKRLLDGILGVAAVFSVGATYAVTFIYGNYGLTIMALLILMAVCLDREHDVLAGLCWALAMTKPQCALLLVIPLFLHRKWVTILTAISFCILSGLVSALMCDRSLVEMIFEIRKLGSGFYSGGTALFPTVAVGTLLGPGGIDEHEFLLPINAVIGVGLCGWMCWLTRKLGEWLMLLAPAVLMSMAWTYQICFDRCIFALPALALSVRALKNNTMHSYGLLALTCLLFFLCGLMPLVTCDGFLQWMFGFFGRSYPVNMIHVLLHWIDAVVAFVLVIELLVLSLFIQRRPIDMS